MMAIQDLVKRYGIEDTRIQVGRERVWPTRDGMQPSEQSLALLESALTGSPVKGSVRITHEEHDRFWIAKGQVMQPMDAALRSAAEGTITAEATTTPASTVVPETVTEATMSSQSIYDEIIARTFGEQGFQTLEDAGAHLQENPLLARQVDAAFMMEAGSRGIEPEALTHALANGPAVQGMLAAELPLAGVNDYLAKTQTLYRNHYYQAEPVTQVQPVIQTVPSTELGVGSPTPQAAPTELQLLSDRFDQAIAELQGLRSEIQSLEQQLHQAQQASPTRPLREQATEMMTTVQKNLATFTRTVRHPPLKQWGQQIQHHLKQQLQKGALTVVSSAKLAARALGQWVDGATIVPPDKLNQAGLDAIKIFGKEGVYESDTFRFEAHGKHVRISLRATGTPIFERGQFNPDARPADLLKLKAIPETVSQYQQQIQAKVESKTASKAVTPTIDQRRPAEVVA